MRWCVIETKPREETVALTHLRRQNFEAYLPLLRESCRDQERIAPMFPGYAFVAIEPKARSWLPIASTRGVKRIITLRPDMPALLPVGWVESMRDQGVIDAFAEVLSFRKGDSVEFVAWPFEGYLATCKWTSERRIGVLFNRMGHESVLICDPKMLRLAKGNSVHAVR